ncbi:hypothetical protein [Rhodopila sp.]|uniref:hypothetical protein n=1 Tax=Rhodopila sp. TaxID=2480087 RepID=UPI003D0D53E5
MKRNIVLAVMLAISPLTGALAQTTTGKTAESTAAASPHKGGATGSTVVPGNKSTMAGSHKATAETKKGRVSGGK